MSTRTLQSDAGLDRGRGFARYAWGVTGSRIVLIEEHAAPRHVTKIISLPTGGFAVAAPYHSARKGWLHKIAVDYSKTGSFHSPISESTTYTADDRVKLSFHPDGFVQLSGENPGRITSGRDKDGKPKGVGVVINKLGTPLATVGPNFAIGLWGLRAFRVATQREGNVVFEEDDYYYRDCTRDTWNGYLVEGFVMPRYRPIRAANITPKGFVLPIRFPVPVRSQTDAGIILPSRTPLFEGPGTAIFNLRLVELPDQELVIGLMVTRTRFGFDAPSGFVLSGPSDMKHSINAMYPAPGDQPELPTINYSPELG